MSKSKFKQRAARRLATLSLAMTMLFTGAVGAQAASMSVGSSGEQVKDLQERLYMLDYYKGPITSRFSASTKTAVSAFQRGAGLERDGIAGPTTVKALHKVTVSRSDLSRVARVVHGEARGESYKGKVAVAAVVMNRSRSPLFPNSIRDVIFAKNAFSVVSDGQFWLTPDAESLKAAKDAAKRIDPTKGALYFYNPAASQSEWFESRKKTVQIGSHQFFK
ncbi:cell wall hydrolase [Paenibacillus sp. NPDC058071]|uniref:cell wall hydrolase n=1 Tax=Paenibacillus sp. NPDC058071 TaxID=3346326 RepID=UPI0036D95795